ncbi:MAG: molybdenum cofactor guanylyltransferase [Armatimonadota bacterium]|nr:molybdenum cofactor guanylyltransferase [Armatimonadota bacterium]
MELTGLVLAGGESRRMGRDKALLDVGGVPMIRRVLEALRPVCGDLVIVTKTPGAYNDLRARVVIDDEPTQAPLIGLRAGLAAVATPWAFAAACDLPRLSTAAVRYLAGLAPGYDAVVPHVGGRWHPLHAVYATKARPVFEQRVREGMLTLAGTLAALRVRKVEAEELAAVDPDLDTLWNVNTESDYRALLERWPL